MVYYKVVKTDTGEIVEVSRDEYVKLSRQGLVGRILEAFEKREQATQGTVRKREIK